MSLRSIHVQSAADKWVVKNDKIWGFSMLRFLNDECRRYTMKTTYPMCRSVEQTTSGADRSNNQTRKLCYRKDGRSMRAI